MTYDEVKQHLYNGGKITKTDWTCYWSIQDNSIYVTYNFFDGSTMQRGLKDVLGTKDIYRLMKEKDWVIIE